MADIGAGALAIAFLSLLALVRATRIAERTYVGHGRLKEVRIEFSEFQFQRKKGLMVIESAPIPTINRGTVPSASIHHFFAERGPQPRLARSARGTTLAIYGGPDPLTVENVRLIITLTRGKVLATRLVFVLSVNDTNLRIDGPNIPAYVGAYQKVVWQLPDLIIPGNPGNGIGNVYSRQEAGVRNASSATSPPSAPSCPWPRDERDRKASWGPPGIYFPQVFEWLEFQLHVNYGIYCLSSKSTRYGWMPFGFVILRETVPIRSMASLMTDPQVPVHIKHVFEQWYRPAT
jgi:hypothetical protein